MTPYLSMLIDPLTPWEAVVAGLLSLMLIIAAWKGALSFWAWWCAPSDSPKKIFRQLARAHSLSRSEIAKLKELVQQISEPNGPSRVFVDPAVWCHAPRIVARDPAWHNLFLKLFGFEIDENVERNSFR